ncbi:MAG TPA: alpha/beta fold hydrolase [Dehalococcoidia bacterium]|nr:alpha/beta fold hydrolase [Dehalococcoidia bacterium]
MDAALLPDYALLDRLGASGQIFYPRDDWSPPPPSARDELVTVADGVRVACRFHPLDRALPSLLFFHGNGEVVSDYDGLLDLYRQARVNLWVADYRGYGASEGRPSFAALVSDSHAVLDRFHAVLDDSGFVGPRFVMGRSLGAHPALELAARRADRLRGLIVESGSANLERLARRLASSAPPKEVEELIARHRAKVAAIGLPALIIHGEYDELVPMQAALELYDALKVERKELVIVPGAGHNDLLWLGAQQYMAALGRFVSGGIA